MDGLGAAGQGITFPGGFALVLVQPGASGGLSAQSTLQHAEAFTLQIARDPPL